MNFCTREWLNEDSYFLLAVQLKGGSGSFEKRASLVIEVRSYVGY